MRRAFSTQSTPLKILIVDGYAAKSRAEFTREKFVFASEIYKQMIARQAPRGTTIEFDTIFPCDEEFTIPDQAKLETYDGCAFTGSSYAAFEDNKDVKMQLDVFKQTIECGVSMFGSCWALQVAARAMGGTVEVNPKGREVGVGRSITLTQDGERHPMFHGKKSVFDAFMSHSDIVTQVPDGAIVLASNEHTHVQAMALTHRGVDSWFVQYHPEYDLGYFSNLIKIRQQRMIDMGFFKDTDGHKAYCEDWGALHEDPSRNDIAWKYGISKDMISTDIKEAETRNWVRYLLSLR